MVTDSAEYTQIHSNRSVDTSRSHYSVSTAPNPDIEKSQREEKKMTVVKIKTIKNEVFEKEIDFASNITVKDLKEMVIFTFLMLFRCLKTC